MYLLNYCVVYIGRTYQDKRAQGRGISLQSMLDIITLQCTLSIPRYTQERGVPDTFSLQINTAVYFNSRTNSHTIANTCMHHVNFFCGREHKFRN